MGGVEEVAVQVEFGVEAGDDVRGSVEGVADNGVAERLHVDADLVGAAGFDADLDEGKSSIGGLDALEHSDVGEGGAAIGSAGGHAGAADEVACDRKVDGDVVFGDIAVDESEVGLGDLALGEHVAKLAVGAVVLGYEDDAAGLLVEAVDDAGAEVAADFGEVIEVVQESVHQRAAVAGVVG